MAGEVEACWCGGPVEKEIATFSPGADGPFRLLSCSWCGTAALVPQPSDAVLQRWYDVAYYGAGARKFVGPQARLVGWFQGGRARLAARLLPAGGRVLDVGCGDGGFLLQLRRPGLHVEGTERTPESAARAQATAGVRVHAGDLLGLDLPDASYDLVTLWHVFEHLARPEATLRRIHHLLKPGGTLLLSLPNVESWQARLFARHWFHHDPPRHLFAFGPRSLAALLEHSGFTVLRTSTFSLEQNPYGVMQSTLNALGFPRDRAYDGLKGIRRTPRSTRLLDLVLLAMLAAPGLAFALAETMAGRGGTMLVSACTPRG